CCDSRRKFRRAESRSFRAEDSFGSASSCTRRADASGRGDTRFQERKYTRAPPLASAVRAEPIHPAGEIVWALPPNSKTSRYLPGGGQIRNPNGPKSSRFENSDSRLRVPQT